MFGEIVPVKLPPDVERRVSIAFLVQPFVAAAVALALFPIGVAVVVAIVAIPITGCAAYPAYEWLRRRGNITFARTVISGVAFGNIPAAIAVMLMAIFAPRPVDELFHGVERAIALGSVVGAVSATAFWLIAGRLLSQIRFSTS